MGDCEDLEARTSSVSTESRETMRQWEELWKGLKTSSDLTLLLAQPTSDWEGSVADLAPRTAKVESIRPSPCGV